MDGEAIKKLRASIGCSARDLARALGLEQKDVLSWERGETFPTKRHVDAMEKLRAAGMQTTGARSPARDATKNPAKDAPPLAKPTERVAPPFAHLDDPEFWAIVRKLLAHPTLFAAVKDLAAKHPDPARAS